jgi:beta-glucanase (GH16 family)
LIKFFLAPAIVLLASACGGGGGGSGVPSIPTVADTQAPVITLAGDASLSIEQNSAYEDAGASATDNIDSSVEVSSSGSVDTSTLGEYIVTFTATDSAGNSSTVDRLVTVVAVDIGVDAAKWFHQTVLPNGSSWFNGEQQHYTDRTDNSYVSDGTLKIVALQESFSDQGVTKDYTSARLNSKYSFTYGRIEVRAKLPSGIGTWPAVWLLGKNISETGAYWQTLGYGDTPWPACGEVDLLEHWGSDQNYVSSATHTPSSFGNTVNVGGQYVGTASSEFHLYELDWSAEQMVFSVDGAVHLTYAPVVKDADTWPFDDQLYLILNVAIQDSVSTEFESSQMEVDYVRVYAPGAGSNASPVWSDEFN